jgi:hypothetical protein
MIFRFFRLTEIEMKGTINFYVEKCLPSYHFYILVVVIYAILRQFDALVGFVTVTDKNCIINLKLIPIHQCIFYSC